MKVCFMNNKNNKKYKSNRSIYKKSTSKSDDKKSTDKNHSEFYDINTIEWFPFDPYAE